MYKSETIIGYLSQDTCAILNDSKMKLQDIDRSIQEKIAAYVHSGKSEQEVNVLIANEFMAAFTAEYERYRRLEQEVRIITNCAPEDVIYVDFITGEVKKVIITEFS